MEDKIIDLKLQAITITDSERLEMFDRDLIEYTDTLLAHSEALIKVAEEVLWCVQHISAT